MSYIYIYIAGTIIFTVYGQLILKYRMSLHEQLPIVFHDKILFLIKLLADPLILSGLLAAFIAALFWLAALSTGTELSKIYPFTILSLVLVVIFSVIFFKESLSLYLIFGILLIITGIFLISRSLS